MFKTPSTLIYPNCRTLNFSTSIFPDVIRFSFRTGLNWPVSLIVEDKMKALRKRPSKSNSLDYLGPVMESKSKLERFVFSFSQTIDLEEDPGKMCVNYPTEEFASFQDCDETFVYNEMKEKYNVMPFWAAKSPDEVTKLTYYDRPNNSTIFPWLDLLQGTLESNCIKPCKSTKVKIKIWLKMKL